MLVFHLDDVAMFFPATLIISAIYDVSILLKARANQIAQLYYDD